MGLTVKPHYLVVLEDHNERSLGGITEAPDKEKCSKIGKYSQVHESFIDFLILNRPILVRISFSKYPPVWRAFPMSQAKERI